ncbi:hypothetical protein [Isoptericola croceus]|uniref:hypothetical protein n=1 Tax=Isoptericola croceus TaxID=3031406 RepID=UPI0023FA27A3|nr:hypothetical protein [Isoptericola croceus]
MRRAASASTPPSFAPGSLPDGQATVVQQPATAAQQPTAVHAPIPAAPAPSAPAVPAPTQVHPPQAPQQQSYTAPVRQPAYQQAAYQQAAYQQPSFQQAPQQQYGYTPQQYAYQQASAAPPPGTAQNPAAPAPSRRTRLTPGWIAFIAVDAILIIVAIGFAFNALRGADAPAVDAGTDPDAVASQDAQGDADEGDADVDVADPGASVAQFAAPSRNISCEIFENQVSCAIAELNQQPAPVEDCDGTTGYVVTLDEEGTVALPCVPGSDKPKKAPKKRDQVAYGDSVTEGDFTCSSRQDGMYCQHDPTGKGFSLARAGVGTY